MFPHLSLCIDTPPGAAMETESDITFRSSISAVMRKREEDGRLEMQKQQWGARELLIISSCTPGRRIIFHMVSDGLNGTTSTNSTRYEITLKPVQGEI